MKYLSARLLATVAALLLITASHARADFLDWSYHWSISPTDGIIQGTNPSTHNQASTGSVAVAVVQDGTGSSTIPAATISTSSSVTSGSPDSYKSNYNLTLTLTDNPSQTSGSLTFVGLISGSLTSNNSSLTNTFQNTTKSITLGNNVYQVTMDPTVAWIQLTQSFDNPCCS